MLGVLGEGGLGIVYLAQQDKPLRRQVALKIIKPGMDSKQVIARFESERQALALLDHENIARIFDAGTTATGSPYFVMEYIKGLAITEYCDRERLSIEDRLRLFLCVCEAIQHAHQKGIIHRDIKPSNILVAVQGEKAIPKVIDFGVAKAISQPLTERTFFTEQGKLIGTPEYMSPEQAEIANIDVDTRSDVYSLGVLLYELLTGVLPFDQNRLRKAAFFEIQRIIREEDPPRPSTRLSTLGEDAIQVAQSRCTEVKTLANRLQKELEWIPLKALRKEPGRRYRSAIEFADDIRNYLSGNPLIAGPESAIYRVTKFVHRNRALVVGVASVLIVLTAGIIVSTLFAVGRSRAHTKAVQAEELAKQETQHARNAQDQAERLAYYGIIQTVSAKIVNNDLCEVRSMLEETDPLRRGWEWGYLMSMCDRPDWVLQADSGKIGILGTSRDGRAILTGGPENLTLWDNVTHNPIWKHTFSHAYWPGYNAFDPTGRFVAVINERSIIVYDAHDGNLIYRSEPLGFCCLCVSPDEPKLYAGTEDGKLFLFNTESWNVEKSQTIGNERIWHIAIGSGAARLAIATGPITGELVYICNPQNFKVLCKFRRFYNEGVRGLAVLDNLNVLLTVENNGIFVRSLDSGCIIAWLEGHSQNVFAFSMSTDENRIATASIDGTINFYDISKWRTDLKDGCLEMSDPPRPQKSLKPLRTVHHDSAVYTIATLSDGTILSAAADGTLKKWSQVNVPESNSPIKISASDSMGAYCTDFRQDGRKLAVSGWWGRNQIILFDTTTMNTSYVNIDGFDKLRGYGWVRFRPKSTEFAVQTFGGLQFHDTTKEDSPQVRWLPLKEELSDFIFDNSGKILAASYINGGLQFFDVENGLPSPINFESEGVEACRLAFDRDCTVLAGLGQGLHSRLYVWDTTTGRLRLQVTIPYGNTMKSGIAFHPEGKLLATGQNNGEILLWDAESGKCIKILHGHGECEIGSLQFNRDGTRLLSGGTDKTMRLWDWEIGKPLLTIDQGWYVGSARFSPDGLSIANTDLYPAAAWIRKAVPWTEN